MKNLAATKKGIAMQTAILWTPVKCPRCGAEYDRNRQRVNCPHAKYEGNPNKA